MKKLILLLFIPLVFTCSSDDDSSDENNTIETPIKEFMMSNVFYYPQNFYYGGSEDPIIMDTYHIFDFQTEPFNRIAKKFWFINDWAINVCDGNGPETWEEHYLCTSFLDVSGGISVAESTGGIIYETDDKLVWKIDYDEDSLSDNINVEFTFIDNETISWKHFGYNYFEADAYAFWEATLSLVDEQELIDRLEYVNYTPADECSTCEY